MTAPFTAEQENRLERIEQAPPAPESYRAPVDRDKLQVTMAEQLHWWAAIGQQVSALEAAGRLLDGTLAPLLDAAEAMQRVEEWAAMHDDMARQYDEAALSVETLALVDEAQQHAEDCRAIAEGVRNALRGESR